MVLTLCALSAACGSAAKDVGIIIGTTYEIEDAVRGNYNFDMLSSGTAQPPVVALGTDGAFTALLADWTTKDSKTWVFKIKDGMKWSDGTDLLAQDILEAIMAEDTIASALESSSCSQDGKELTLVLSEANVRFLSSMTYVRPVPTHEAADGSQLWCGPFVLDEYNRESGTISFSVNKYYPQKPAVTSIIFRLFSSEDTMYMALQNGDIDMVWNYSAGIPVNYQSVLSESGSVSLVPCTASNVPAVLGFNNAKGFFADKNLRMAVSYALDYEQIRMRLGSPSSEIPCRGFAPTPTIGYKETERLAQDLNAADAAMASAGYTSKNAEGFYVDKDGKAAGFELTVNSGKESLVAAAEMVKNQLEAFGIMVKLDAVDATAYNAKTSNKFSENNITMEAAIYGYTSAGMAMGAGLGSIYVDGNHPVQGGCQVYSEKLSSIEEKMAGCKSLDEYKTAASELQDFYAEECPLIALYWDSLVYGVSSNVSGFAVDANFGLNNVNSWSALTKK